MAKEIWAETIEIDHPLKVDLPPGAKVVYVGRTLAPNAVRFWYEFTHPLSTWETRTFEIFGTGQEIPDEYQHVGTVVYEEMPLVWHLYERV